MARAHAANACVQSDSIKGLAQSIAKPAYHRLLTAEPALRRAVPTLIIAFLITICLGAFVQVIDQNRHKRSETDRTLAVIPPAQLLVAPGQQGVVSDMALPGGTGALAISRLIKSLPGQVV